MQAPSDSKHHRIASTIGKSSACETSARRVVLGRCSACLETRIVYINKRAKKKMSKLPYPLRQHRYSTTHAQHMYSTCTAHAQHMHSTCTAHAQHMHSTCTAHVQHMHSTCTAQKKFKRCRSRTLARQRPRQGRSPRAARRADHHPGRTVRSHRALMTCMDRAHTHRVASTSQHPIRHSTAQSSHKHSTVTAQSQHSHSTVTAQSPRSPVTPSDYKHQSASDPHGHDVGHTTRRVQGGAGL